MARNPIKDQIAIVGVGSTGFTRGPHPPLPRRPRRASLHRGDPRRAPVQARHRRRRRRPPQRTQRRVDARTPRSHALRQPAHHRIVFTIVDAMNAIFAGSADTVLAYHAMYRSPAVSRSAATDPLRRNLGWAGQPAGRALARRPRIHRGLGRLHGVGQPLPPRVRHPARAPRLRRRERPHQRDEEPPRRHARTPHAGRLPRRPHGPRSPLHPRHGHPRRRRRRLRPHHRRTRPRPDRHPGAHPRRHHRHHRQERRGPDPRPAPPRPARRRQAAARQERHLDPRRRRLLPLRRLQLHHAVLDREHRLVRPRRGRRLRRAALGQGHQPDLDRRPHPGEPARRRTLRRRHAGLRARPRSRPRNSAARRANVRCPTHAPPSSPPAGSSSTPKAWSSGGTDERS